MPNKSKLTPEVQEKICAAIAAGNYDIVAARYAGISDTTFYRWLKEGEEAANGIKHGFWVAVKDAGAKAEVRNVALIENAASFTWQAAAWWLERKYSDRWGRRERLEHVGDAGGPMEVTLKFDRPNNDDGDATN